jgi:hypothetical protein
MNMTPTSRTLALLRRSGYAAAVVERWIPKIERRADLWHFADVLAVHPLQRDFLLVQCTSISNVASRLAKARQQPELAAWLLAGGRFEVHGWRGRDVKRVEVVAAELPPVVLVQPRRRRKARWQPAALFAT